MSAALLVFVVLVFASAAVFWIGSKIGVPEYASGYFKNSRLVYWVVKICLFGIAVSLILAAVFAIFSVFNANFNANNKVDSFVSRAQQSATAMEMTDNLNLLATSMEQNGLTQGYSSFVFQNASTDMAITYQHVLTLRDRASEVSAFDTASLVYPLSMQDLRDSVNGLSVNAGDYFFVHSDLPVIAFYFWLAAAFFWIVGNAIEGASFRASRRVPSNGTTPQGA